MAPLKGTEVFPLSTFTRMTMVILVTRGRIEPADTYPVLCTVVTEKKVRNGDRFLGKGGVGLFWSTG